MAKQTKGLKANLNSTTTPAPEPSQPLVIVVPDGGAVGTSATDASQPLYQEGMVLSTDQTIADFWRLTFAADTDDAEGAAKIGKASTAQIMAVLKAVKIDRDMSAQDAFAAYLQALVLAPFMLLGSEDIPTTEQIKMSGVAAVLAKQLGEALDAQTVADMEVGIKGKIEADACPVTTANNIKRQFGDMKDTHGTLVLSEVPPMHTKYIPGQKGNRAPAGFKLPDDTNPANKLPVWNGSYNKSRVENRSGMGPATIDTDWIAVFTASTPDAGPFARRIEHIKAAMKGAEIDNCPPDVHAMRMDDNAVNLLATAEAEASYQFNRRKVWYGQAFELLQAIDKIESRFKHITVEQAGIRQGDTQEVADRKRKPYCLVTVKPHPTVANKFIENESKPQYASRILGIARKAHEHPPTALMASLLEQKRGTKAAAAVTPAGADTGKSIANLGAFTDTLERVKNYLMGDKENLINARINDPKSGPEFCSYLCYVYDALHEHATMAGVREKADIYNALQSKAQADDATAALAKVKAEQQAQAGNVIVREVSTPVKKAG